MPPKRAKLSVESDPGRKKADEIPLPSSVVLQKGPAQKSLAKQPVPSSASDGKQTDKDQLFAQNVVSSGPGVVAVDTPKSLKEKELSVEASSGSTPKKSVAPMSKGGGGGMLSAIQKLDEDRRFSGPMGRLKKIEHRRAMEELQKKDEKELPSHFPCQQRFPPCPGSAPEEYEFWRRKQQVFLDAAMNSADGEQLFRLICQYLSVDQELIQRALEYLQKAPEWILIRWLRLTGSNFGAACGENKWDPEGRELLRNMVWLVKMGNAAMEYGNLGEPLACCLYFLVLNGVLAPRIQVMNDYDLEKTVLWRVDRSAFASLEDPILAEQERNPGWVEKMTTTGLVPEWFRSMLPPGCPRRLPHRILHRGIVLSEGQPFFATSPDGDVRLHPDFPLWQLPDREAPNDPPEKVDHEYAQGLLEIKCPTRMVAYPELPPYYRAQIQGAMGLRKLEWCDFVVYAPLQEGLTIARYPFDSQYYERIMQKCRDFYWKRFVPLFIQRLRGELEPGQICPIYRLSSQQLGLKRSDLSELMSRIKEGADLDPVDEEAEQNEEEQ